MSVGNGNYEGNNKDVRIPTTENIVHNDPTVNNSRLETVCVCPLCQKQQSVDESNVTFRCTECNRKMSKRIKW